MFCGLGEGKDGEEEEKRRKTLNSCGKEAFNVNEWMCAWFGFWMLFK